MIQLLQEIFSYGFLVRAILVGSLVALCAALLGVSLVLKRYSMIGDGLSHVGFGALSIAMAMNVAPLAVAIPVVVAAAFLLLRLSQNGKLRGDSAIALISSGALAAGVLVTSLSSGLNADVYGYMFGSILSMGEGDVILSLILALVVLVMFILFYNNIFAITFDESFARATGTRANLYSMIIALLTALTVYIDMPIMATMMISGVIMVPALTALRLCLHYRGVLFFYALVSVLCFLIGMVLSYAIATPAGASIVMTNVVAYCIFWAIGKLKAHFHAG